MIEKLNHAQIINKCISMNKRIVEDLKLKDVTCTYENAFHSIVMNKINEIIDKVNTIDVIYKSNIDLFEINIKAFREELDEINRIIIRKSTFGCTCGSDSTACCPFHTGL